MHAFNLTIVLFVILQFTNTALGDSRTTFTTLDGKFKRYFYMNITAKVNWFKARKFCRDNGMELLSIESEQENSLFEDLITEVDFVENGIKKYKIWWTSGNDLEDSRKFMWGDYQRMFYTKWKTGEPNNYNNKGENCVELLYADGGLRWNDATCNKNNYFICQYYVSNKEEQMDPIPVERERPKTDLVDQLQMPEMPEIRSFPQMFQKDTEMILMNKTYYFSSKMMSYAEADQFCKDRDMLLLHSYINEWNINLQKFFLKNMGDNDAIWLHGGFLQKPRLYCAKMKKIKYVTDKLATVYGDCSSKGNTVCVK